jgi:hypothetical protein
MTKIYAAMTDELAIISRHNGHWQIDRQLIDLPIQCVAVDPHRPEQVYCGTFGHGLWRSQDAGRSWQPAGAGIPYGEVMSVAVSPLEYTGNYGVVWAGTEPSALFRSEDGGQTWQERPALRDLPSAPTWRFPPRPWTHHVRWIAPDPVVAERLFAGIELGGIMRSLDAGLTWEDRKPGSQHDVHTIRTHPLAPGRVYEAAGGGYAQSFDGGSTWQGNDAGLSHWYLWGLAVDPGNPETILVSAAPGPRQAHTPEAAEAVIYRKVKGKPWQQVHTGLPEPKGTMAYRLTTNDAEPGIFYTAANRGLYRSEDAGLSWQPLNLAWPDRYHRQHVHALVVTETD